MPHREASSFGSIERRPRLLRHLTPKRCLDDARGDDGDAHRRYSSTAKARVSPLHRPAECSPRQTKARSWPCRRNAGAAIRSVARPWDLGNFIGQATNVPNTALRSSDGAGDIPLRQRASDSRRYRRDDQEGRQRQRKSDGGAVQARFDKSDTSSSAPAASSAPFDHPARPPRTRPAPGRHPLRRLPRSPGRYPMFLRER